MARVDTEVVRDGSHQRARLCYGAQAGSVRNVLHYDAQAAITSRSRPYQDGGARYVRHVGWIPMKPEINPSSAAGFIAGQPSTSRSRDGL